MQIEEDTHDDFHRTDLEGGEDAKEPAAAEADAPDDGAMDAPMPDAPMPDAPMPEAKDDYYN